MKTPKDVDFFSNFNRLLKDRDLDPINEDEFVQIRDWVYSRWPKNGHKLSPEETIESIKDAVFWLMSHDLLGEAISQSFEYVFHLWARTRCSIASGIEPIYIQSYMSQVQNELTWGYFSGTLVPLVMEEA